MSIEKEIEALKFKINVLNSKITIDKCSLENSLNERKRLLEKLYKLLNEQKEN